MKTIHYLKTWPEFYEAIDSGEKNFEVRKDDRNFVTGDILQLEEWDPALERHTGRSARRTITYILRGGQFGVERGFVVLSLN